MTLPPPPPMPPQEPDEVVKLLLALDAYVDERVKLATASSDMHTARERTVDAAKLQLEIALRHALFAAAHNRVSRVPSLRPGSSQRMRATALTPVVPETLPAPPPDADINLLDFDEDDEHTPDGMPVVDREAATKPEKKK